MPRVVDLVTGATGSMIGSAVGMPHGMEIGAQAGPVVRQLMNSTAWRTGSVVGRRWALQQLKNGVPLQEVVGMLAGTGFMRASRKGAE